MAFTPIDVNKAEVRITGTAPDYGLDFYIPRGERGEVGPTGPQGPAVPTNLSIGTIEVGPAAPGTIGPQGATGPKGDPGGITLGTSLGTADLNTIQTAGIYRQGSSVPANCNYPTTELGVLIVQQPSANPWLIQEYQPAGGIAGKQGTTFYRRTYVGTTWSSWKTYAATRVDQTAGRVIYQWDDLNSRDQLIYGDTGWRGIALDPTYGVVASGDHFGCPNGDPLAADTVKLRRVGNRVYLGGNGPLQPKFDYSSSKRNVCLLPPGYRASGSNEYLIARYGNNGGDSNQRMVFLNPAADYTPAASSYVSAVPLIDANWNNYATGGTWPRTYGGIWCWGMWLTNESWPTVLPGTAIGSIPTS